MLRGRLVALRRRAVAVVIWLNRVKICKIYTPLVSEYSTRNILVPGIRTQIIPDYPQLALSIICPVLMDTLMLIYVSSESFVIKQSIGYRFTCIMRDYVA